MPAPNRPERRPRPGHRRRRVGRASRGPLLGLIAALLLAPTPAAGGTRAAPPSAVRADQTVAGDPVPSAPAAPTTPPGPDSGAAPRACATDLGCGLPCYGAAARDPLAQPCLNPKLALSVFPTPSNAELEIGARCTTKEQTANWWVCAFGPLHSPRTFALVGDSHAGHWRPALGAVATGDDWRGISITRSSCPFTQAITDLPPPLRTQCIAWNQHVHRWFDGHPEVSLVFVSEHAGASVVVPPGKSALAAKVAGYTAAWAALPSSVKHIVVIRDTPLNTSNSFDCVERAIARRQRPGIVCAVPRRHALGPDPEVSAATLLRSPRVGVIDLTPELCGSRFCYPVIGGVLVHRDIDHLTAEYSTTLGPFLVRALHGLMAAGSWSG